MSRADAAPPRAHTHHARHTRYRAPHEPPKAGPRARAPHAKRAAKAPATCTAEAHVRSARSLSYAAEPCCAGECRIACATAFLSAYRVATCESV